MSVATLVNQMLATVQFSAMHRYGAQLADMLQGVPNPVLVLTGEGEVELHTTVGLGDTLLARAYPAKDGAQPQVISACWLNNSLRHHLSEGFAGRPYKHA
ncbi:MAG: hypothetical protein JSS66_05890 [Armatimonadetes bacterium]|nr:hypothetical protein [Armatimonadota bacterium]